MANLSRDQVRRLDRCAIETIGVPGVVLMENAGRNAADAIETFLTTQRPLPAGRRIAIVAGAGNNGGDGFVIARHLAMRAADVTVFLIAPEDKLTGDARINLTILQNLGQDVRPLASGPIENLAAELGR